MVSNTPSPTSTPWSKGEMRAASASSSTPFAQTCVMCPPASRRRSARGACSPATASRRAALSSVSAHSASGRESATIPPPTPEWVRRWPVPQDRERADGDGEFGGVARGVDPADGAAVDTAAHGLEVLDRLQDARLRRARDRGRRERRPHQRAEPDVVAQAPLHRAHEVVEAGMRLDRAQRRHRDGARCAHAPEVVARRGRRS